MLWEGVTKPPIMPQHILDYPYDMCKGAFHASEVTKEVCWEGGEIFIGHPA